LNRCNRNDEFNDRAGICVSNRNLPAQFLCSLPHAGDSHACLALAELRGLPQDAHPIITYGYRHFFCLARERDPHFTGLGVPEDVRQRLLNDAEQRGFHLGRKPREIGWPRLQRRLNSTTLRESLQLPAQRRTKTDFVQERRMQ
jgi:hypothetical protein